MGEYSVLGVCQYRLNSKMESLLHCQTGRIAIITGMRWQFICTSYCPTTITAIPVHQQTKQNKTTKQNQKINKNFKKINKKNSNF